MDQLKVRSDAFGYCSFAVNSFVFVCLFVGLPPTSSVLRLSSFLIFFLRKHCTQCWGMPSCQLKGLWEWLCWYKNTILCQSNCLWPFFVDSTKEMETNDLKCLKIQFKVGSLLSFVLCVDTTLILELVLLHASAWSRRDSSGFHGA